MLFSKKPKKTKELQLDTEHTFYVTGMAKYQKNFKNLGKPTSYYSAEKLPMFGKQYYEFTFDNLTLNFIPPSNNNPILVTANDIIIGEISMMDAPLFTEYVKRNCIINYWFRGGNYIEMDIDGVIEKGFYPYYCNITFTLT